ncbi:MAG: Ldh family oxidoreductase [Phycisphaerales bacterium]|nr:Ldh family oxidoreductase [Phycisphaerales bacterium]
MKCYVAELFSASGVDGEQCEAVALNIVWSELVERTNYGVLRIPALINCLENGVVNPQCQPRFENISTSCMRLDADNGFGHFAGEIGMNKAVEMARETGIGIVGVKNSNFFGTGAYFVDLAAKAGMVSLAMSNSFPKVVAYGGTKAVLGTNPFAFGAPRQNGDNLMVDFATSALAGSTVREYVSKGKLLPEGLATLPNGDALTDPARISEGSLTPFGGAKGYGISLMVEILAGILTGAGFSHSVKSMYSNVDGNSDSGHCLIAIDVEKWMSMAEFFQRFEALIVLLKASGTADEVLLPGEVRWRNYRENLVTGISIPMVIVKALDELSDKFDVSAPWVNPQLATGT